MKIMKKISAVLLALVLCVPCVSMVVHAADGNITFTDPETKVGDMVDITCAVRSSGSDMGDIQLSLSYDSAALRFESGDGVAEEGGVLKYSGSGGSSEVKFTMKFQALAEGSTKVSIESAAVNSSYGGAMSMEEGDSTVTIGPGDPSKIKQTKKSEDGDDEGGQTPDTEDMQVDVDGTTYILSNNFADADIPAGYSRTTITLEGQERQMVANESGNITLGYLLDSGNVGEFYIYREEDASFAPYEEISISDTTSIIVLDDASKVKLPSSYKPAKLTLNEKEFPVWNDSGQERYYILYAVNNKGETGYYQYDSEEGTYQRIEISQQKEEKKKSDSSFTGKLRSFLDTHFKTAFIVFGIAGAIVLLLIIVLAVKLRNRNLELDDLYDEYGIDVEEEPEKPAVKEKKAKGLRRKDEDEDDFAEINLDDDDFDDSDDFDEDDFDDRDSFTEEDIDIDDFDEDDFDEDDLDNGRAAKKRGVNEDDFDVEDFDEDDFDDIFSEEKIKKYDTKSIRANMMVGGIEETDDLDDLLEDLSQGRPGHQEEDDAFKVDFVDLD